MFHYSREADATMALLDKIDLKEYLQAGFSVNDIQAMIQEDYDNGIFPQDIQLAINNKPFEGFVFNELLQDEFMTYVEDRYGMHWHEETRYYLG